MFHQGGQDAGFELARGDRLPLLRQALREARASGRKVLLFIYSLRPYDLLVASLYARRVPIVIYYQNIPPEHMPLPKRLCMRYALGHARLILLQDTIKLHDFRTRGAGHRARFFPWVVDDTFFCPTFAGPRTNTLFIPGDRGRLDDLVLALAARTGRRIIRVSRYFPEPILAAYRACPNIELHYYARWEDLLRFYQETAMVLNMTDDSDTSAGMTTFLEGLAMNALVLTPDGHSCAGYHFPDGTRPYLLVHQPRRLESWLEAIAAADRHPRTWPAGRAPRDLVLQLAGTTAAVRQWREMFTEATT